MILFKLPNGTIDDDTRAEFQTAPFDLDYGPPRFNRRPDPGWSLGTATILVASGGLGGGGNGGWGGMAWGGTAWEGITPGDPLPVGPSEFASTGMRRGPDPGWSLGRGH